MQCDLSVMSAKHYKRAPTRPARSALPPLILISRRHSGLRHFAYFSDEQGVIFHGKRRSSANSGLSQWFTIKNFMNFKNMLAVIVAIMVSGVVINTVNAADLAEINGVNEIWSGRYEGQLDWTHQPHLLEQTNVLEGRIGTSFGVFFSLQTEPQDAKGIVRLRYKTIFPEPGMLNA